MFSVKIAFQRLVDKALFFNICRIFGFFKINKDFDKNKIKNILIIKLWALGDSIVVLPLIDALKKGFPNAKIDVLAHKKNKVVFEGQKNINKIIDFGAINIMKNFRKYYLRIGTAGFC